MIPLYIFPLSVVILTPLYCFVPYAMAVYYGHVHWWLPLISDAGGVVPEASIFSQLLDINAIMIAFSVFIEYKRIKIQIQTQISDTKQTKGLNRKNNIFLICGFITSFTLIVLGNYRMPESIVGHIIGVIFLFVCGPTLSILLAFLSTKLSTNSEEKRVANIRVFIAVLLTMSLVMCLVFSSSADGQLDISGNSIDAKFRLHWSTSDPGYTFHWLSSIFEWIANLSLVPLFATFIPGFKQIDWKCLRQTNDNKTEIKSNESNDNQIV